MVFSSLIFILAFLPVFLAVYYLLPYRFKNLFIVIGGYFFYSWGAPRFAFILLLTITADYLLSLAIARLNQIGRPKLSRYLLIASIIMNIAMLGYFKYSNFFVAQVNWFLHFSGLPAMPWREVILPIGISFTIFQELSYIIEVYKGKIRPARTLVDFAAYLMLFPHVIAGPIVRYVDIAGQLENRHHSSAMFFEGIRRFSIGLAKKALIANTISGVADAIFYLHQVRELSSPMAWFGLLAYAMQIYFDFSGYSDMAIGLAKMIGFNFLENFNQPYIATSITDFWRRWHISLSTWMREYLYIPLGGNRISAKRTYFNLWIVFLISGLWHGASWNFVIWGAYHGLFLVFDRMFWLKISAKISRPINVFITFIVILIGWTFFRIENIGSAIHFIQRLFDLPSWFTPVAVRWTDVIDYRGATVLIIALLISFAPATSWYEKLILRLGRLRAGQTAILRAAYSIGLFLFSLLSLTNAQYNPFIYFRF